MEKKTVFSKESQAKYHPLNSMNNGEAQNSSAYCNGLQTVSLTQFIVSKRLAPKK